MLFKDGIWRINCKRTTEYKRIACKSNIKDIPGGSEEQVMSSSVKTPVFYSPLNLNFKGTEKLPFYF